MQLMTAKEFLAKYNEARDKLDEAKLNWGVKFNHAHALSTVIETKEMELKHKE